MSVTDKIVLAGGAGLVGQNLAVLLSSKGYDQVVCIDKHAANLRILKQVVPEITAVEADLSKSGEWSEHLAGAGALVILQAQIGGLDYDEFVRNNVTSTELLIAAAKRHGVPYTVHISSSVVNSQADDFYSRSKRAQEALIEKSGLKHCVLRPTLMFGWFDRKHLGWLARFMKRAPVFPVPGHGRYIRQPLFELDFCAIIAACLERRIEGSYNISGLERITYIDLVRAIKKTTGATAAVVKTPYRLFWLLLTVYALFDRHPPFTTQQLAALVIPEEFEMIDWPGIFGVRMTPWREALERTFHEKPYCDIVLEF